MFDKYKNNSCFNYEWMSYAVLTQNSTYLFTCSLHSFNICQWRRKVPKSVCVCGGGGGGHRHIIYVPSVKNQYKRFLFGFTNIHLCQFIEIVHKIINWYMKNAK